MIARLLALSMIGTAQVSAAAEPLRPTSKWNVDYDLAQCTASRNYGTEDKPLLLVLKPSPFGGTMRLLVISKGGLPSPARQLEAGVQFDSRPKIRTNALKFANKTSKVVAYSVILPVADFKAGQGARSITLTSFGLDRTFTLDSVPSVLALLENCRVDLLQVFNANKQLREGATPVKPLARLYSSRDYPTPALDYRDQGAVNISLLIDETGKVMDCSVDSSAGAATLDTMSCYIIQERAAFKPAIGTDGKPAKSVYNQRIVWRIRG